MLASALMLSGVLLGTTCPCSQEPPQAPWSAAEFACCDETVRSDLVAAGFTPGTPQFVRAVTGAELITRGAHEAILRRARAATTADHGEIGAAQVPVDGVLLAILRTNADRARLAFSPRQRDAYRKLLLAGSPNADNVETGKTEIETTTAARDFAMLARLVARAEGRLRATYFDRRNALAGLYRDGAVAVFQETLAASQVEDRDPSCAVSASEYLTFSEATVADKSQPNTGLDSGLAVAIEYMNHAIDAVEASDGTETALTRLYAERALVRATARGDAVENTKGHLMGALNDIERARQGGAMEDPTIVHDLNTARGLSLFGLFCETDDPSIVAELVRDEFSYPRKPELLLLLARTLRTTVDREEPRPAAALQAMGLLHRGYGEIQKRLGLGYLELVEGWPQQVMSSAYRLDQPALVAFERDTASGLSLREGVKRGKRIPELGCALVREYIDALQASGASAKAAFAQSLNVRVVPELCSMPRQAGGNNNHQSTPAMP